MQTPSLKQFTTWAHQHHGLAKTVVMAQAYAQLKREQVDAYIAPIFARYDFRVDPKFARRPAGEKIMDIKDLYLTDLDSPQYKAFLADCDRAHRKHSFDGPENHCPALIAEHLQLQAETVLLDAGCKLMGLEHIPYKLEHRAEMLKILMGACLKEPTA